MKTSDIIGGLALLATIAGLSLCSSTPEADCDYELESTREALSLCRKNLNCAFPEGATYAE